MYYVELGYWRRRGNHLERCLGAIDFELVASL